MKGNVASASKRRLLRKSYYPFKNGMRGLYLQGVGANLQYNTREKDGHLEKVFGAGASETVTGMDVVDYLYGYEKSDGTYQKLAFGTVSSNFKMRAIDSDGSILTPALEIQTQQTGTITTIQSDATITGSGTAFTTEFAIGDWIVVSPGDGIYYQIDSITSDTELELTEVYAGTGISGTDIYLVEYPNGAGDIIFTSDASVVQHGTYAIISGKNNIEYSWDGEKLVAITGCPSNIIDTAKDGARVGYITAEGDSGFSDNNPLTDWSDGTGANANGSYNSSIALPTKILQSGVGVIIFGKIGAEAHWVQPNNASDSVSSRTKIETFIYRDKGVDSNKKACIAGNEVYFVNEDGIQIMDAFSGKSQNLIIGGKIERFWKEVYNQSNASIGYDPKTQLIACVLAGSGANNYFILIDTNTKELSPSISGSHPYNDLAEIGGELYGGSIDGKVVKVFADEEGDNTNNIRLKYITEWDDCDAPDEEKTFYNLMVSSSFNPNSQYQAKIYFDGSSTAAVSYNFTAKDLTRLSEGAVYGEYVFAIGLPDLVSEGILATDWQRHQGRFTTIAIEITELSKKSFTLYDIIIEYKRTGRFSRSFRSVNNLITT